MTRAKSSGASPTGNVLPVSKVMPIPGPKSWQKSDQLAAGEILMVLDGQHAALIVRHRSVFGQSLADRSVQLEPLRPPGGPTAFQHRRQAEPDHFGIEQLGRPQGAFNRPHHSQAGADDGCHAEACEPVLEGLQLIVRHRRQPGIEDFQHLGFQLGGDGDEAVEPRAAWIGARRIAALQAEVVSEAVGIEAGTEQDAMSLQVFKFSYRRLRLGPPLPQRFFRVGREETASRSRPFRRQEPRGR